MKKIRASTLRILSALAIIVIVCIGLAIHTGTGTPSAFGIYDIAAICPLGALETLVASKTIVSPVLIGLAIMVILTLLFGRAFCAWGCPVPLLRKVFGLKAPKEKQADEEIVQNHDSSDILTSDVPALDVLASDVLASDILASDIPALEIPTSHIWTSDIPANRRGSLSDSRNWVLGGTLLTTAIFGFPVFCVICPIGLSFATLIAVWRLFQFNETTLSLVVFPAILIVELLVARKWCHKFCPLGALLSLVSRGNRTWRPVSDGKVCLHMAQGESCHRCTDVCPEGIDLHDTARSAPLNECTKCRECADACPVHAVRFPFMPKK